MRWSNVRTIFRREVIDQLRDRRTLFMILGLPLLLYPILGIGMTPFVNAFAQKPRTVVVVGAESLPDSPPLLNADRTGFLSRYFDPPSEEEARRLRVVAVASEGSGWEVPAKRDAALRRGDVEAVVLVPPDLRERLAHEETARLPVAFHSADEPSQNCALRVRDVLANWRDAIVKGRLRTDNKGDAYVRPVTLERVDVARAAEAGAGVWARLFPFLLVMMALTGAFYPAIDLCAGEKERGTMETLLISPASRVEIVLGKFLTVMVASIATAVLNLASLALTGWQLARSAGGAGPSGGASGLGLVAPSPTSMVWMILLLIPLSVFFSAICLALAVLARSMKEGQYYMTPLYLVAMPLIFLTLLPGVELNLFTSLVPITGAALLLRALIQAKYDLAAQFSLAVLVPTLVYGIVALRWAVDQFQNEAVLFREAEHFNPRDYLIHLVRDREPTPGPGMAVLCFVVMLSSAWFVVPWLGASPWSLVAGQATFILGPPALFAMVLTSCPARTLLLTRPRAADLLLGAALALSLNPLVSELRPVVSRLFPMPEAARRALEQVTGRIPNAGLALLMLAIVPAVCEEVAFRGFILSGLRRRYRTPSAIVLTALLFGFLHVLLSLFQQLFNATLLGLVLGLLAVKTGSLWPCVVFHATNNALAVLTGMAVADSRFGGAMRAVYRNAAEAQFRYGWIAAGAIVSAVLIASLARRPDDGATPSPSEGSP